MKLLASIKTSLSYLISWNRYTRDYLKFLKNSAITRFLDIPINSSQKIAVVIHPWHLTPAPFFTITIGILLCKKGNNVDFIIDDNQFGYSNLLHRLQVRSLLGVCKFLPPKIRVIKISELEVSNKKGLLLEHEIDELAKLNTIHFMRGELKVKGRSAYYAKIHTQLKKANVSVSALFNNIEYRYLYLAGGIYGTTGIYVNLAKRLNIRVNTYDSGKGVLLTSTSGIAAQLSDIPLAFKKIKQLSDRAIRDQIIEEAKHQLSLRRSGKDSFTTQIKAYTSETKLNTAQGCLILLNSPWDSAALGIHRVFTSYSNWLLSTIEYIINHTDENVIIRQHPSERFPLGKSNDDYENLIKQKFGYQKRIKYINCYSDINTYQLMGEAKLIICFSSTAGIESVLLKKPVIVASRCYYSDLGFVQNPKNNRDYFQTISSVFNDKVTLSGSQIDDAYICYFLGQSCNWIFTEFTPMYQNYQDWTKTKNLEYLYSINTVQLYLHSIETGVPLAYTMGLKKLGINTMKNV